MGNFYSASESYLDVFKFASDDQIDFEFNQMRTFETVKSAGQQQALAQMANVGGLGGGGGGFSALTPWGNTPSIWLGVSNFFVVSAVLVVPVATIVAVLAFVLHLGRVAAFFSVFFAVTFASIWLMYHTRRGLSLSTFPTLALYGIVIGGVAGLVAALVYSEPAAAPAVGAVPIDGAGVYYPVVPARPVRF
jgi:hypothetical protein